MILDKNNLDSKIIICDVDDVIVYTTSLWYDRIFNKPHIFSKYIDINKMIFPYHYRENFMFPYTRNTFYFIDWLKKDNLSQEELNDFSKLIHKVYEENHFYLSNKLLPSAMLFSFKRMLYNKKLNLEKLIFVTRTFEKNREDKIEMIRTYFRDCMDKVEIVIVDLNEKKSEAVSEYTDTDKVVLVLDDEIKNIDDYIENNKFKNCNYLIPKYGFNSKDEDIEHLIKLNENIKDISSSVHYYSHTFKENMNSIEISE